jgi:hypothetical protein
MPIIQTRRIKMKRLIALIVLLGLLLAGTASAKVGALWNGSYYLDLYSVVTGAMGANITVSDNQTDTTEFPVLVGAATGSVGPRTRSTLTYNAVTGLLSTTLFSAGSGAMTVASDGNITTTGDVTAAAFNVTRVPANSVSDDHPMITDWYEDKDDGEQFVRSRAKPMASSWSFSWPNAKGTANQLLVASSNTTTESSLGWTSAPTVTSIDIGSSDTTLARVSAGLASIEGNTIATNASAQSINFITSGTLQGMIKVTDKSDNATLTTAEMSGGMIRVTAAKTMTLPAVAIGNSACVYSTGANVVKIRPNGSDGFVLNGVTRDTDGHGIYSAGAAGDFICFYGDSADGWTTLGRSGTWTSE